MKLIGRIIAILVAAVLSVLAVQQVIKRMYKGFGRKYIELSAGDQPEKPE